MLIYYNYISFILYHYFVFTAFLKIKVISQFFLFVSLFLDNKYKYTLIYIKIKFIFLFICLN